MAASAHTQTCTRTWAHTHTGTYIHTYEVNQPPLKFRGPAGTRWDDSTSCRQSCLFCLALPCPTISRNKKNNKNLKKSMPSGRKESCFHRHRGWITVVALHNSCSVRLVRYIHTYMHIPRTYMYIRTYIWGHKCALFFSTPFFSFSSFYFYFSFIP